jgi:abhydrolase domain-containing protein 12
MSFLWRKMPMFDFFFTGALTNNDVGFVSDQKIKDISVPILILHAKVTLVLDKITS